MRYLGYEVCLLACRIAGVPDRQCNAFHCAQTCQPEGDSRSGFLPAGLPSFPVPRRAQRLLVFSFDYSACGQPIASSDLAAYCSASSARAEFLQRVRRLLTGGSLRPACALGGNRLASLFQDEVLQQPLFLLRSKKFREEVFGDTGICTQFRVEGHCQLFTLPDGGYSSVMFG